MRIMCFCGIVNLSVHSFDYSCRSAPLNKVVTQFTLDKGTKGSHSIICKVTCCLLSLFLLHILFVFKCFRQPKNKYKSKDVVKLNCLISITLCISSSAVNKTKPTYLTFCRFFVFFAFDFFFFDTCLNTCAVKIVNGNNLR